MTSTPASIFRRKVASGLLDRLASPTLSLHPPKTSTTLSTLIPTSTSRPFTGRPIHPPLPGSHSQQRQIRHFITTRPRLNIANDATPSPTRKACPFCSAHLPLSALVCRPPSESSKDATKHCGALQPIPPNASPYSLLSLDVSQIPKNGWDVDLGQLKNAWRKGLGGCHPDRMAGRNEKEKLYADQQSSALNKAYETLREPLDRALYLLKHHSSSIPSESESLSDPSLLMQVMELREMLEEIQHLQRSASAAGEEEGGRKEEILKEVREELGAHRNATLSTLSEAFSCTPPDVERARKAAIELRYWDQIERAAKELEVGGSSSGGGVLH